MQVPFTEMGKDEAGAGLVGVGVKLGAQPNMYEAGVVYDTSQWECPGDHWTHESISGERSRLEIEMGGGVVSSPSPSCPFYQGELWVVVLKSCTWPFAHTLCPPYL